MHAAAEPSPRALGRSERESEVFQRRGVTLSSRAYKWRRYESVTPATRVPTGCRPPARDRSASPSVCVTLGLRHP
eukprot:933455-Prorocentrum_minimum.AAC.1